MKASGVTWTHPRKSLEHTKSKKKGKKGKNQREQKGPPSSLVREPTCHCIFAFVNHSTKGKKQKESEPFAISITITLWLCANGAFFEGSLPSRQVHIDLMKWQQRQAFLYSRIESAHPNHPKPWGCMAVLKKLHCTKYYKNLFVAKWRKDYNLVLWHQLPSYFYDFSTYYLVVLLAEFQSQYYSKTRPHFLLFFLIEKREKLFRSFVPKQIWPISEVWRLFPFEK